MALSMKQRKWLYKQEKQAKRRIIALHGVSAACGARRKLEEAASARFLKAQTRLGAVAPLRRKWRRGLAAAEENSPARGAPRNIWRYGANKARSRRETI